MAVSSVCLVRWRDMSRKKGKFAFLSLDKLKASERLPTTVIAAARFVHDKLERYFLVLFREVTTPHKKIYIEYGWCVANTLRGEPRKTNYARIAETARMLREGMSMAQQNPESAQAQMHALSFLYLSHLRTKARDGVAPAPLLSPHSLQQQQIQQQHEQMYQQQLHAMKMQQQQMQQQYNHQQMMMQMQQRGNFPPQMRMMMPPNATLPNKRG